MKIIHLNNIVKVTNNHNKIKNLYPKNHLIPQQAHTLEILKNNPEEITI